MPVVLLKDDITIEYDVYGSNDAKTKIIFIMGLICPKEYWHYQIDYFKDRKDVQFVIFNNRGIGNSSRPKLFSSMEQYADDTKLLLDELEWLQPDNKIHMVGISMGGMISLEFASKYGELLEGLILINTHAGGMNAIVPIDGIYVILKNILYMTPESIVDALYGNSNKKIDQKNKDLLLGYYKKVDNLVALSQTYSILGHYISNDKMVNMIEKVKKIGIIVGMNDILIDPINSLKMNELLKCQMLVFAEGGHGIIMEESEKVNKFLEELIVD